MDLTAMQEKITKAAKWSDFRVRREKIIDDFIKVKRTQALIKKVHTQMVVQGAL